MNDSSITPLRSNEPRRVCPVCAQIVDLIYQDPDKRTILILKVHTDRSHQSTCSGSRWAV